MGGFVRLLTCVAVQHNSRRAELHRLQDKHPEVAARLQARELEGDGTESSSSEEEVRFSSCGSGLYIDLFALQRACFSCLHVLLTSTHVHTLSMR